MLFKRYSNPFPLINNLIRCRRFFEYVQEFIQIRNEELDNQASWEYWLHKDMEHSFSEFLELLENNRKNQDMKQSEKVRIVKESQNILSSFVPMEADEI